MLENAWGNLSKYRMEKAKDCLITAKNNLVDGDYSASINRSYYAIFHSIRALLILDGLDFKKHSAVIAKFRELYIKTELLDKLYSTIAGNAFILRNDSDYHDFFLIAKEDAEKQIESAAQFIEAISQYLSEHKIGAAAP